MITQAQIGNIIYPLSEEEPIEIKEGDTIKVYFSFKGKVPQTTEVRVWASVYHTVLGVVNRQEWAQSKGTTTLEPTAELTDYSTTIDIYVSKPINTGLFGLLLEFPDYDVSDMTGAVLHVTEEPGIFDMIGPILILGLLAFMLPMLKEGV